MDTEYGCESLSRIWAEEDDLSTWQIEKKELREKAQHLLQTELWSDCSFIVGKEPNKKVFHAHRLFLAMSSPVFEAMLYHNIDENNEPISVPDIDGNCFKDLLEYIYTDKVDLLTLEQASGLCHAAIKYMILDLAEKCILFVRTNLLPEKEIKSKDLINRAEKIEELKVIIPKIIQNESQPSITTASYDDIYLDTYSSSRV